ncbi:MAG: D-alanyl-D-alanine carboxypeptidase family protein [Tissierellia bacterium]|nr:D-alanyl-D-alanine carboxypeptidase family protein [Tissierellia bacterium]
MRKRLRVLSLVFSALIVFTPAISKAERIVGYDEQVESYMIGEEKTGEVFYEKNADQKMPIASMSKIMTYLLTKEAIDENKISLDDKIEVSKKAAKLNSWEYSALGLEEGMKIKVEDLIKGLIVVSGNDCAEQLAELVAGDEKEFAKLMNKKAEELGLETQSFYNASGIQTDDDKQNSSSARDMFKLCQYVIKKYPEVLDFASIKQIDINDLNIHAKNILPLVGEVDGVDGLKTGTTEEAGYCLISTVDMNKLDSKDQFRTIAVVMNAQSSEIRESAAQDLIYYVSRFFDTDKILNTDTPYDSIKMNSVKEGYVDLYPKENLEIIRNLDKRIIEKVDVDQSIKAPIKKGEKMGVAKIKYDDKEYDVDLIAAKEQKEATKFSRVIRAFKDSCNFLLECLIAS